MIHPPEISGTNDVTPVRSANVLNFRSWRRFYVALTTLIAAGTNRLRREIRPWPMLVCYGVIRLAGWVSLVNVAVAQSPGSSPAIQQPTSSTQGQGTVLVTKEMTGPYRPRHQPRLEQVVAGIIEQTNKFRKAEKLEPLTKNDTLQKTAQEFADYMARTGKYGHEADDRTPSQRAEANHYELCFIGENIAMQYRADGFATGPLTKALFQGWKNSPPHRANQLQPDVTETGVAVAQSTETGAFFAVQLVGRPLSRMIRFSVRNDSGSDLTYQFGEQPFDLPERSTRQHQLCSRAMLILKQGDREVASIPVENGAEFVVRRREEKLVIDREAGRQSVH